MIIEKVEEKPVMAMEPVANLFVIKHSKVVKDMEGNDVEVFDREEQVTLQQLESQKAELLKQIGIIDEKVAIIKGL